MGSVRKSQASQAGAVACNDTVIRQQREDLELQGTLGYIANTWSA